MSLITGCGGMKLIKKQAQVPGMHGRASQYIWQKRETAYSQKVFGVRAIIAGAGHPDTVILIVINSDEFSEIRLEKTGKTESLEKLLSIIR